MKAATFNMTITGAIKIWICWENHYVVGSYEEVVKYSINNGLIDDFSTWLNNPCDYNTEDIFEMTNDTLSGLKAEYNKYFKRAINYYWEEMEITI